MDAIVAAQRECGIKSLMKSRIQGGKFQELESVLLQCFKESCASNIPIRHGLETRTISGEIPSMDEETVEEWKEELKSLIKRYNQKNCCDETGLFFRMMPEKLAFKVEPCQGGRNSKERFAHFIML
nr:uncharacterized protein LOC107448628 [Parasteatoda tepidariorum]